MNNRHILHGILLINCLSYSPHSKSDLATETVTFATQGVHLARRHYDLFERARKFMADENNDRAAIIELCQTESNVLQGLKEIAQTHLSRSALNSVKAKLAMAFLDDKQKIALEMLHDAQGRALSNNEIRIKHTAFFNELCSEANKRLLSKTGTRVELIPDTSCNEDGWPDQAD